MLNFNFVVGLQCGPSGDINLTKNVLKEWLVTTTKNFTEYSEGL